LENHNIVSKLCILLGNYNNNTVYCSPCFVCPVEKGTVGMYVPKQLSGCILFYVLASMKCAASSSSLYIHWTNANNASIMGQRTYSAPIYKGNVSRYKIKNKWWTVRACNDLASSNEPVMRWKTSVQYAVVTLYQLTTYVWYVYNCFLIKLVHMHFVWMKKRDIGAIRRPACRRWSLMFNAQARQSRSGRRCSQPCACISFCCNNLMINRFFARPVLSVLYVRLLQLELTTLTLTG
jgi:hypothetical protein